MPQSQDMFNLIGDELKGKPDKTHKTFCVSAIKTRVPMPKFPPLPRRVSFVPALRRFVAKPVLKRLDLARETLAELRSINGL